MIVNIQSLRTLLVIAIILWQLPGSSPQSVLSQTKDTLQAIYALNPKVDNVEASLLRLRSRGDFMAAWNNGHIAKPWYTSSIKNKLGFRNHFQGIQRLRDSNYLIVSGSNPHQATPTLFIVKMASRREVGDWASNVMIDKKPPGKDAIIKTVAIDSKLWHVGGLGLLGNLLAIPLYGGKPLHGKIIFYDVENPENPRKLDFEIDRPYRKAYEVALTKLSNGRFIAAVESGRDGLPRRLDFYLSKSRNILDGFQNKHLTWLISDVQARKEEDKNFGNFQSITFIQQSDGRLYLVGIHNTAPHLGILPGKDYADLYEVVFPEKITRMQNPVLAEPIITKIANRQFSCKGGYCNMDAASCLYIDSGGRMTIYSTAFWLDEETIKFISFSSEPDPTAASITDTDQAWIDLYEQQNFKGRRLSLFGVENSDFSDYGNLFAQGKRIDNKVSSARFQIPAGWIYRLYENKDYEGKFIDFVGSGQIEFVDDFQDFDFNDNVSSSRFRKTN